MPRFSIRRRKPQRAVEPEVEPQKVEPEPSSDEPEGFSEAFEAPRNNGEERKQVTFARPHEVQKSEPIPIPE